MTRQEFDDATKDMERRASAVDFGGTDYFVLVHLIDGSAVFGTWAPVKGTGEYRLNSTVIRFDRIANLEAGPNAAVRQSSVYIPLDSMVALDGPLKANGETMP